MYYSEGFRKLMTFFFLYLKYMLNNVDEFNTLNNS